MVSKNNLKEILDTYPELFGTDFDPKKTLMGFGFEVGPYWREIVISYLPDISTIVKENDMDDFIIIQIKEKFGRLAIYTRNSNDEINEIISQIALECSKTCDKCGSKENVLFRSDGWLRVRCDTCEGE